MPRFAFSTFVKMALLPSHELSSELEKYSKKGSGYDFYRTLRAASKRFAGDGQDFPTAVEAIAALKTGPERAHNLAAATSLKDWISKKKPKLYPPPEAKIYQGPKKKFEIRIEPEFTMEFDGALWLVHVFNSQKLRVTPTAAEPALHLLKRKYADTEYGNYSPGILDLGAKRLVGKVWNSNRAAKNFSHLVDDITRRLED
ncbi:hypothetical protein E5163_14455 [Marinicauda algicola]|uniref:Uncharacterized protein n=1 Tax=Marinicauda algicola TaxID=2029849 RepID=A0A4S2GXY4_9PROT|nr:hypothetical protein [Marinicauda algicola]TGY87632.1 hypothetical protein E5163_14455 [Marinicauda algicola]